MFRFHMNGTFSRAPKRFLVVFVFSLSLACGLVAAANVAVDPFGYFGFNRTGLFFDDERTFKLLQAHRYPHQALLLGDSRTAYVNPEAIRTPRFFNAAFGGASLDKMVWFWEHYGGNARVVVMGVLWTEVDRNAPVSERLTERSWRDPIRYALSFELLWRSYDGVPGSRRPTTRTAAEWPSTSSCANC
jgi:hypothetical protein